MAKSKGGKTANSPAPGALESDGSEDVSTTPRNSFLSLSVAGATSTSVTPSLPKSAEPESPNEAVSVEVAIEHEEKHEEKHTVQATHEVHVPVPVVVEAVFAISEPDTPNPALSDSLDSFTKLEQEAEQENVAVNAAVVEAPQPVPVVEDAPAPVSEDAPAPVSEDAPVPVSEDAPGWEAEFEDPPAPVLDAPQFANFADFNAAPTTAAPVQDTPATNPFADFVEEPSKPVIPVPELWAKLETIAHNPYRAGPEEADLWSKVILWR